MGSIKRAIAPGGATGRRRTPLDPNGGWDEAYGSEGLYQLNQLARGDLNLNQSGIAGMPKWQENLSFDETGNWRTYGTAVNGSSTLSQGRTHNAANEIKAINNWEPSVGYDGAGNMTVMPKVGDWNTSQTLKWDAWNRLVKITEGTTPTTIGEYRYDGLTRRLSKQSVEGGVPTLRHFYYSAEWQVLEERTGTQTTPERQFVWGLRYIDDLVLRDRKPAGSSSSSTSSSSSSSGSASILTERLYATHDQWHVTGVLSPTGTVLERYAYKAFGESVVLTGAYASRAASAYDWETRFGAYRYDRESNICQVRHRSETPSLGRWLSRDPLETDGSGLFDFDGNISDFLRVPSSMSLYAYVANRTSYEVDPKGLFGEGGQSGNGWGCKLPGFAHFPWHLITPEDEAAIARDCCIYRPGKKPGRGGPGGPGGPADPGGGGGGNDGVFLCCLATCAAMQFLGIDGLRDAGLILAGQPFIPKARNMGGMSKGTSLAAYIANLVFGNAQQGFQLPMLSGGWTKPRIAWSKTAARTAGRAVPVIGWGLVLLDAAQMGECTAQCMGSPGAFGC